MNREDVYVELPRDKITFYGDTENEKKLNEALFDATLENNRLEDENKELKEDISFCLKSIKQEMEMSTDSRTRSEMSSCYEILSRWNNDTNR